jgi:hypothetical protein
VARRYHTSDCCPVSRSSIRSPCVEQEICTTSPERRERTAVAAVLGRSRTATSQSRPPQLEWTVKEIGALGAGAGAMVVATSARDAVEVEAWLLVSGATCGLDLPPSFRPTADATATAATPSRTTTAAKTRNRLRDRSAGGVSPKASAVAGTTTETAWVRSSVSVLNAGESSTPNADFSNAMIRSPASARVSGVVESSARVVESDLTSDGKSHSVSRSLSSGSSPESDPLAMGRKWYSLDGRQAGWWGTSGHDLDTGNILHMTREASAETVQELVDQIETNRERKLLARCWSPRTVPALIRPYAVSTQRPGVEFEGRLAFVDAHAVFRVPTSAL